MTMLMIKALTMIMDTLNGHTRICESAHHYPIDYDVYFAQSHIGVYK